MKLDEEREGGRRSAFSWILNARKRKPPFLEAVRIRNAKDVPFLYPII
jgi:hypothetical protein